MVKLAVTVLEKLRDYDHCNVRYLFICEALAGHASVRGNSSTRTSMEWDDCGFRTLLGKYGIRRSQSKVKLEFCLDEVLW